MRPDNDRARPVTTPGGPTSNLLDSSSIPRPADLLGDLDALAEHLRGYFVVQVVINDAGHRRSHFYRNAQAAERAVERARLRGRHAHVTLCQLMPVGVVTGVLR